MAKEYFWFSSSNNSTIDMFRLQESCGEDTVKSFTSSGSLMSIYTVALPKSIAKEQALSRTTGRHSVIGCVVDLGTISYFNVHLFRGDR